VTFNPYLHQLATMDVASLVSVIFSAPVGSAETTELEWKSAWDMSTKPRRADLARHIIGFANRDPDQAMRFFGGHAFILIGVAPGTLGSAPELDPADIVQALTPYTGTQLSWHPVYVPFQGSRVLVLVIDPPRWGDPVWRLERGSEDPNTGRELKSGTVYVRRPGTTVAADAGDMARLNARASVPRPDLAIAVDWNLGSRGNYVGVSVHNGPTGSPRRPAQHVASSLSPRRG
jgi:hypothetical protein